MKKHLLISFFIICSSFFSFGQVTLENIYDLTPLNNEQPSFFNRDLVTHEFSIVRYSSNPYRIVSRDYRTNPAAIQVKFYSTNHSLQKTFSNTDSVNGSVIPAWNALFTDYLFTTNGKYAFISGNSSGDRLITDEEGNIISTLVNGLSQDENFNCSVEDVKGDLKLVCIRHSNERIAVDTGYYNRITSRRYIYDINDQPVVVTNTLSLSNLRTVNNSNGLSNPVPNPSRDYTVVEYSLPEGVNEGEVVVYDMNGNIVKTYGVDRTFNHLRLNNTDLNTGTYLYSLKTSEGISDSKKMMVIK